MSLVQKRVRVAKISLAFILVTFLVLVLFSCYSDHQKALYPLDLLQEARADQPATGTPETPDPLGIVTEDLRFERCTDDEFVLWYSTLDDATYSQVLVDRALVSKGWSATSSDASSNSYAYYSSEAATPLYAFVLFYEQAEGCSVIIEVI